MPTKSKGPKKGTSTAPVARRRSRPAQKDVVPSETTNEADKADQIEWDTDLTWSLVTAIENDEEIRLGLYPLPGSNKSVAKGGSKNKTEYQWALAQLLFNDHPKYGPSIKLAASPAEQRSWTLKVKNRLKRMGEDVSKYRQEMGQTGAGIMKEADIDMGQDNEFTNAWAQIKEVCPWYWRFKDIISERPSAVPVGLGNNGTPYDISVLSKQRTSSVMSDEAADGSTPGPDILNDAIAEELDTSDDDLARPKMTETAEKPKKRKATESKDEKPIKTPALTGKSAPAIATPPTKKAKSGMERFTAIAAKEEETTQMLLGLKKTKVEAQSAQVLARIKAKADVKMEKERLKAELARVKMEQEFRLRMAQMAQYKPEQSLSMSHASSGTANYLDNSFQAPAFGSLTAELRDATSNHQDFNSDFGFFPSASTSSSTFKD